MVPASSLQSQLRQAVGIVSTSRTALFEVACLLAHDGAGVSQTLHIDGSDLETQDGGNRLRAGLQALQADDHTEVIVLIAGWSTEGAMHRVLAEVRSSDKPTVICFLGVDRHLAWRAGAIPASRLDEAAMRAAAWIRGWDQALISSRLGDLDEQLAVQARELAERVGPGRRGFVGLLSGGIFCHEAELMLDELAGTLAPDPCQNLGDEPQAPDLNRLLSESLDNPDTAVILLDLLLLTGKPQSVDELIQTIESRRHGSLVITHLCDSAASTQARASVLQEAGVILQASNSVAARLAAMVLAELDRRAASNENPTGEVNA